MNYLYTHSLAASTLRLYQLASRNYSLFCTNTNLNSLPVTEFNLMFYVTSLASRLSYKSIKVYLSGIQFHALTLGHQFSIPTMHQLYYLLRGIRRTQGNSRSRARRLPITIPNLYQLQRFIKNMTSSTHDKRLFWSAVTLGFFGLLRSSEFTATHVTSFMAAHTLLRSDIHFAPGMSYVAITIKSSKTDPFRVGCIVRVGATCNPVCPVSALHHFIHQSRFQGGPLYTLSDGSYLTRACLAALFVQCFGNSRINTHSLRIGGASTMASAGLPNSSIMTLGRWTSNAYQQYIRVSDATICRTSRVMSETMLITKEWNTDIVSSMHH